jgi:hypothetical protein
MRDVVLRWRNVTLRKMQANDSFGDGGREAVEVSYTTTLDDYVAYSVHMLKRSPSMKWQFAVGWAVLPVGCWLLAAILASRPGPAVASLAFAGVAYAVVYPLGYRKWVGASVRAYAQDLGARGVIGRITLVLDEDTLTERTEAVQSIARWRDMKGMEVVGDCTYIYVTGLLAAIIPKHGFERPEDYEAVRDFALARLQSKSGP